MQPRLADDGLRWMSEIVPQELQARKSAIAQIRVVAQAERRKQVGREKILEILVTLPDCNGPVNARIIPAAARAAKLIVSATFSLLAKLQSSAARASSFLVKVDVARRRCGRTGRAQSESVSVNFSRLADF